ncbi:MAG: S-layer homology domain-containing protein [Defluviitaleaceae bacterium]|nr:S-layer homology domain-containing protein [Defluviitaleaceae bacterium]
MKKIFALIMVLLAVAVPVAAFGEEVHLPVASMSLSNTFGQVHVPMDLDEMVSLFPARGANHVPVESDIEWSVVNISTIGPGTLAAVTVGEENIVPDNILYVTGNGQGTVRLRATIPTERNGGVDFTPRYFNITFGGAGITAEMGGLTPLFVGVPVNAQVLFTLDGGYFLEDISPWDFWVTGLPAGLIAAPAERVSSTVVAINITGSPIRAIDTAIELRVPNTIHFRNIRQGIVNMPVFTPYGLSVGNVAASSGVWPLEFTFDLNPDGALHRDFTLHLNTLDFNFNALRYGEVDLREFTDFTRNAINPYLFTINRSFLRRLPIGSWDLTFVVNRGANPTVTMTIIDTSLPDAPLPPIAIGPHPTPPTQQLNQPGAGFMFLTGGAAVNLNNMRWDLNRARVNPEFMDDVASVIIGADILENLPGEFDIVTPIVRLRIPSNFFDIVWGGRAAIAAQGLTTSQVNVRISLINRSNDTSRTDMFFAVYPNGELLSPLVELKVELLFAYSGEVFFTAFEFTRPLQMIFTLMNTAGHMRPAGVMFSRAWLEFVPFRMPSQNEIVTSTIFPGVQAIMHNRARFDDIHSTHWGFVQSYTAAYSGLVAPMEYLHPDTPITRGEFAQLLSFAMQLPRADANVSGFVDVPPPNVFFDGVSRVFAAGLLGPFDPAARFNPNQIITREEIAAITGRAIALGNPVIPPQNRPISSEFIDHAYFTPENWLSAQVAVNHRVMIGYPDRTFRPQANGTRIYALEAVVNLVRVLELIDDIN